MLAYAVIEDRGGAEGASTSSASSAFASAAATALTAAQAAPAAPQPPSVDALLRDQHGIDLSTLEGPLADAVRSKVSIGADGKLKSVEQVLKPAMFVKVVQGMSQDQVRRLIGAPFKKEPYALSREVGWHYRYLEGTESRIFVVQFDLAGQGRHDALDELDDAAWVHAFVTRLTQRHEATQAKPWAVSDAPADFIAATQRAIVGIEITLNALTGKWKTSQNRSAADRDGVARGLADRPGSNAADMAALVAGSGKA